MWLLLFNIWLMWVSTIKVYKQNDNMNVLPCGMSWRVVAAILEEPGDGTRRCKILDVGRRGQPCVLGVVVPVPVPVPGVEELKGTDSTHLDWPVQPDVLELNCVIPAHGPDDTQYLMHRAFVVFVDEFCPETRIGVLSVVGQSGWLPGLKPT